MVIGKINSLGFSTFSPSARIFSFGKKNITSIKYNKILTFLRRERGFPKFVKGAFLLDELVGANRMI